MAWRFTEGGVFLKGVLRRGLVAVCACLAFSAGAEAASFQLGDEGPEVAAVQQTLLDLGYDVVADGDFGPGTAAAVRDFERAHGLTTDGVVGAEVYQALMGRPFPAVSRGTGASSYRRLIALAKQYLGVPYVYGGSTPGGGFDCSGFVYYVFGQMGVRLPRCADDQYLVGRPVSKENLQPGDLVFFSADGIEVSHVGIYLQGGEFIHASSNSCITYDTLERDYRREHYVGARRIPLPG